MQYIDFHHTSVQQHFNTVMASRTAKRFALVSAAHQQLNYDNGLLTSRYTDHTKYEYKKVIGKKVTLRDFDDTCDIDTPILNNLRQHGCHVTSDVYLYAAREMYPDERWRVYTSDRHSTVVSDTGLVFDPMWQLLNLEASFAVSSASPTPYDVMAEPEEYFFDGRRGHYQSSALTLDPVFIDAMGRMGCSKYKDVQDHFDLHDEGVTEYLAKQAAYEQAA